MREKPDTSSLPPAAQRIVFTLRTFGWISFCLQIALGIFSVGALLFALFSSSISRQATQGSNPGTGFGIFFAVCGLVVLGAGAYLAWRYILIARQLRETGRPSKAETLKTIRLGLIISLVGMLLTILGAFATIGVLLAKSATQVVGAPWTTGNASQFVQSADLWVVQANTNTIAAHFAGIAASLWLFNRVSK